MRTSHRGFRLLALLSVVLFVAPLPAANAGVLVQFQLEPFEDTLFASVDAGYRVAFDHRGHMWYTTPSGVVHVDVENHTRDLFTRSDGLPSSYALGLAVRDGKAYVGTDLGLAVIDVVSGKVIAYTPQNSQLPDYIVQDILPVGDELFIGTYFGGVAIWNPTTDAWRLHNTSTTATYASPVKRITATDTTVLVATDGDGLWRYDRAAKSWSVLLKEDGLATNALRVAREAGENLYVGSENGLQVRTADGKWVHFNKSNSGLPDDYVLDLDFIPVDGGGVDLFAATREGLWQYDGDTGQSVTHTQSFGILGTFVLDNSFTPYGWAIATTRGISLQRGGEWSYYVTGPSSPSVPSQGPGSFMFTSASVGNGGPVVWFGGPDGVYGYRPADGDNRGVWYNRGEWSNYTGGPVNWIDTDGDITWVGSNTGAYGFRHSTQEWFERKVTNSRNLVYGLEADRGEVWIGLFGDGLIMRNLTTGVTRSWSATSTPAIPDLYVTDVRAQGNDVWLGSSIGVTRLDRTSGEFTATYTVNDGIPGAGIVFRVEPEGNSVWIATKDAGVAKLDLAQGRVTHVWNATNTPGFPEGEVRSMHREGNRLWAGTTDGLARVDLSTGNVKVYRASNSDLVQNYVNGITSRNGILYLATLSGVARLDIETDKFLGMQEGERSIAPRSDAPRAPVVSSVSANIFSPRHLELVSGAFQVSGSAHASGGQSVDRVEVQIGDGAWQTAMGTTSWTYTWDTTQLPLDQTVSVRARAISGANVSRAYEVLAIPIEAPQTPLRVEALAPSEATAGRDLVLSARASGDPPLAVTLYYKSGNATTFTRADMALVDQLWQATVPGRAVKEGDFRFYVEARSGRHALQDPADVSQPYALPVIAAPQLAVSLAAPDGVDVDAGTSSAIPLKVTNTGNTPVTVRLEIAAEGPASRWVKVPAEDIALEPGASRDVTATAEVEAGAYEQTRSVTVRAVDATGVADPATAEFPMRIQAAPASTTPTPTDKENGGVSIPMPAPMLVAALAAGVALALRQRRRDA